MWSVQLNFSRGLLQFTTINIQVHFLCNNSCAVLSSVQASISRYGRAVQVICNGSSLATTSSQVQRPAYLYQTVVHEWSTQGQFLTACAPLFNWNIWILPKTNWQVPLLTSGKCSISTLNGSWLPGQIPNNIGNLVNLTQIYLSNNQLTGEPQCVVRCLRLELTLFEQELSLRASAGSQVSLTWISLTINWQVHTAQGCTNPFLVYQWGE